MAKHLVSTRARPSPDDARRNQESRGLHVDSVGDTPRPSSKGAGCASLLTKDAIFVETTLGWPRRRRAPRRPKRLRAPASLSPGLVDDGSNERVAHSIACAELTGSCVLTDHGSWGSTRVGEVRALFNQALFNQALFKHVWPRARGEEHRTRAAWSEGAREAVFERWAHSADGRGGSPASGVEIAISLHVGRAKTDEVTEG
jgi:hypothetical protein